MKKSILALLLLCLIPHVALSETDLNIEQTEFVPFWPSLTSTDYDMTIEGDFLYVNNGNTLRFNLADPLNPQRSGLKDYGFYSNSFGTSQVLQFDNYCLGCYRNTDTEYDVYFEMVCYSLEEEERIWTISTGNYHNQDQEWGYTCDGESVQDICHDGEYAYLTIFRNDFSTVNLTTGSEVVYPLDESSDIDTYGIDIQEDHVFIACGVDGVRIVNVEDPINPYLAESIQDIGDVTDLFIYENHAYFFTYNEFRRTEIKVYDITDPVDPQYCNTITTLWEVIRFTRQGQYLYLIKENNHLEVFDLSNFENAPSEVILENTTLLSDIAFYDNYFYVMDSEGNLDIYQYNNIADFTFIKSIGSNCLISEITILNNYAIGTVNRPQDYESPFALKIYNLNNMDESYELEEGYYNYDSKLTTYENAIIYKSGTLIKIFDFTDPTSPALLSTINTETRYGSIFVNNGILFILETHYSGGATISAYDIHDLSDPVHIVENEGLITESVRFYNFVDNKLIISFINRSMLIIDISDPENLSIVGNYSDLDYYSSIETDENYIYTLNGLSAVSIWDYSDPDSLQLINTIEESDIRDIFIIENEYLFCSSYSRDNRSSYIKIININNINNPLLVGRYRQDHQDFYPAACTIRDGQIFISDSQNDAFSILDYSQALGVDEKSPKITLVPSDFAISRAYPNPFNPTLNVEIALPQSGLLQVNVFNVLGQQVATLTNQPYSAGTHSFTFDGSSLASGVYFVKASLPGQTNQMQKVVLMK